MKRGWWLNLCLCGFAFGMENATPELSIEEKVGQLLLVHFHGTEANADAKQLLERLHVGAFIYYNWANDLSSPKQVAHLSDSLQKMNQSLGAPFPLLIAIDQEGGRVCRLKEGFQPFPSPRQVASTGCLALGTEVAEAIGNAISSVGINLNLAPVVDLASKDSIIGDRAFGEDPIQVTLWGRAYLDGFRRAGIASTLKHYPGHGRVKTDSHFALPILLSSSESLELTDLYPFHQLAKDADAMMTAHLLVPALDPLRPATLSPIILEDLLRRQWGFEGVIISDSLVMKGIADRGVSYEEIALSAFEAGCDLLCLGGKLLNEDSQDELTIARIASIHRHLTEAVLQGRISPQRLDLSVKRILTLKSKYARPHSSPSLPNHLQEEVRLLSQLRENITLECCAQIGQKIWTNESNCNPEKILSWNLGEEFLSVGIGHFIWYPKGITENFMAGFPAYIHFLEERHYPIPNWLKIDQGAPWHSREDFLNSKNAPIAENLHKWLMATIAFQAEFMTERLVQSLHRILSEAPIDEKCRLIQSLEPLIASPEGIFALVDYLNFKGEGLSLKERYNGNGWGLYQVLLRMPQMEAETPLDKFSQSASAILSERVADSPPARGESRWLPGWKNRVDRYLWR